MCMDHINLDLNKKPTAFLSIQLATGELKNLFVK